MSRLRQLAHLGQSVWLDFLDRALLASHELDRLIAEDDLRGLTSNPSIFEKAIAHGDAYDAMIAKRLAAGDAEAGVLFEYVAVAEIREAADRFRPVYERTEGLDGYVSLEVSPYLAMDTEGTIAEARRLWQAVDRPNLMIKVPGTPPGVPAIRTLIGEGINVNVTLLFSLTAYEAVAEAYMAGLEEADRKGLPLPRIASVASFFVSRIDGAIEAILKERLPHASPAEAQELAALEGKVAIANAKRAYQLYKRLKASPRWQALAARGARPQRLLWASTSTKSPKLPDTLYVDALIGPETVNTMPPATLAAVRDHGTLAPTLETGLEEAERLLASLDRLGISLDAITEALVTDGVRRFADDADKLLAAVARKREALLGPRLLKQTLAAGAMAAAFAEESERWRREGKGRALWRRDAALWTGRDEGRWLGWLDVMSRERQDLPRLEAAAEEIWNEGLRKAALLGMGGSSLGARVLLETLSPRPGRPSFDVHVLDSIEPREVRKFTARLEPGPTLFIVASKSGSTLEPELMRLHFTALDPDPRHFAVITDPGSPLEKNAAAWRYRAILHGEAEIGGRYSVLSKFGLVPAALRGLDVTAVLEAAEHAACGAGASVPPEANPALGLGLLWGVGARAGRDKITLFTSPRLAAFGAWFEQLLAESLGKEGKGLVPVADEPPLPAEAYGKDRSFVALSLAGESDPEREALLARLAERGHPVVRIVLPGPEDVGGAFFHFEIATAVAGAVIGVNPFDQPDVEAAKIEARRRLEAYEREGSMPGAAYLVPDWEGLAIGARPSSETFSHPRELLTLHFRSLEPGDYVGLLAYLPEETEIRAALTRLRGEIGTRFGMASTLGFGPRYLHSTGQLFKGGPKRGLFFLFTADPGPEDLPIPGKRASFGQTLLAQAFGDLEVLARRGQRVVHVHLKEGVGAFPKAYALLESALRAAGGA
jgi:transaldolase/glucose-6-phosphate isomerase